MKMKEFGPRGACPIGSANANSFFPSGLFVGNDIVKYYFDCRSDYITAPSFEGRERNSDKDGGSSLWTRGKSRLKI